MLGSAEPVVPLLLVALAVLPELAFLIAIYSVFHRKSFYVLWQNSTLVPPTELSLRQSRGLSSSFVFASSHSVVRLLVAVMRVQGS